MWKHIELLLMYGRGTASIAEQVGCSVPEAQEITNDFFNSFPKVKKWMDETEKSAKEKGYVEDFWGRRRRLPDIQLPKFTVKDVSKNTTTEFNPLLYCKGLSKKQENPKVKQYENLCLSSTNRKELEQIKKRALADGIEIINNGGKIAQAERQSVNARVQGGASTMSKIAMIKVFRSKELKDLGFRLLLQVHDELIGECPRGNEEKVAEVLTNIMKSSVEDKIPVPFKCDASITSAWYEDDYSNMYLKIFKDVEINSEEFQKLKQTVLIEHCELNEKQLEHLLLTFIYNN